jgi:hypothetical protein
MPEEESLGKILQFEFNNPSTMAKELYEGKWKGSSMAERV